MPGILIVKTSSLGDLVHTMPMITDIVREVPDARIDWVVEEAFAEIPRLHPRVEQIIPIATRRWRKAPWRAQVWRELGAFTRRLREPHYDFVIDAQGLIKSAVIARAARRPVYGRDRASIREPLATVFYRHRLSVPKGRHAVWRNRMLAAQVFGYSVPENHVDYGMRVPAGEKPPLPANYVLCIHGCSDAARWWPNENWVALCGHLLQAGLTPVLPWGNAAEERNAKVIAAGCTGAVLAPRLTLLQLARAITEARAVIGVDTGPLHLSMGLARPTVAIFTYTDPKLSGAMGVATPWGANVGHIGVIPTVTEVLAAAATVGVLPAADRSAIGGS